MEPAETSPAQARPGTLLSVLDGQEAVIWLKGEIDLTLAGELSHVAALLPRRVTEVVLDASGITFCDGTLTAFIEALLEHRTIWLRQPAPLVTDFLRVVGLGDQLRSATDPTLPTRPLAACR